MNIMMVASGDLWAGAEVMVHQLVQVLSTDDNMKLCVIILNQGRLAEEIQKIGVEVHVVDETQHSFFTLCLAVRKLVKTFSPNVIHSHRYKENLVVWFAALGNSSTSLVATQHGMPEIIDADISFKKRFRTNLFFRLLSYGFDRTVLVSEEMQQLLLGSYGFTKENVTVIHNGISMPKVLYCREEHRVVVGTAGRLFPVKDFLLFVEVANMVIQESEVADFVIAGDGPQYKLLKETLVAYGLEDRFQLLGHQDDMASFYKSLDIYINTSVHEGIPMSVLEAMSYGLPVIVPEVGGFPEIVDNNKQGFLIKDRQKKEYTKRLLQLINNKELRRVMASAAQKKIINCFSCAAMARAYLETYATVFKSRT